MTEKTGVDLEVQHARMTGRTPNLEAVGNVMGLKLKNGGAGHEWEASQRIMMMEAVTECARDLLALVQGRTGMTVDSAEAHVNRVVNEAYEKAAQNSHYDSERYQAVLRAIEADEAGNKRRTPLVTEAQAAEHSRSSRYFTPSRIDVSRGGTINDRIVEVLRGN